MVEAARTVQTQKTWISVDEYQDTNPLQERLLELWIGESVDLAVVGDPDQTIYTFTGATPDYLRLAQIGTTVSVRCPRQILRSAWSGRR